MANFRRIMTTLELHLLRRSVGAQERHRDRCRHCHRTPLTGEQVFFYGAALVCELCRPLHRQAPERAELMHSSEHDRAVRLLRAA
jgi:hypothetical protein